MPLRAPILIHAALLAAVVTLSAATARAAVGFSWATIGGPGNACDPQPNGCQGAVAEVYRIAIHEVTNAQYTEFLNAVAVTDANDLYSTGMATGTGGITRSGSPGSYGYSAIAGREDLPVNHVSFWDATRFANWLHNGQPSGAQDDTTTEDGAYTLDSADVVANTVERNAGALFTVATEAEWYKAAYYDPGTTTYYDYPAGADTQTTCTAPGATSNTANCDGAVGDFSDVGSYTGAPSPNGTYDQGGNVYEWVDAASDRALRGGPYSGGPEVLAAAARFGINPTVESGTIGFRLSSPVPPPVTPALPTFGLLVLAGTLLASGARRLRRVGPLEAPRHGRLSRA